MEKWQAHIHIKRADRTTKMDNWDWLSKWPEVRWVSPSTNRGWDLTLCVDIQDPKELEHFVETKLKEDNLISDIFFGWQRQAVAA